MANSIIEIKANLHRLLNETQMGAVKDELSELDADYQQFAREISPQEGPTEELKQLQAKNIQELSKQVNHTIYVVNILRGEVSDETPSADYYYAKDAFETLQQTKNLDDQFKQALNSLINRANDANIQMIKEKMPAGDQKKSWGGRFATFFGNKNIPEDTQAVKEIISQTQLSTAAKDDPAMQSILKKLGIDMPDTTGQGVELQDFKS